MPFDSRFNVGRGYQREFRILVTYMRTNRTYCVTREGWGKTIKAALADADAQLRPGLWQRVLVSSPAITNSELRGISPGERRRLGSRYGEGAIVEVPQSHEVKAASDA